MIEAGLPTFLVTHFVDHPGIIIWLFLFGLTQRFLYYRSHIKYSFTIFIAAGGSTLLLRIISQAWFENFLRFFTDLIHR